MQWSQKIHRSVRVSGSPEVRQSIIDRSWEVFACPRCHRGVQVHQFPMVYLDMEGNLYIAVEARGETPWRELLKKHQNSFDQSFFFAPEVVRTMSQGLQARLVFGFGALREKIILHRAGLDDYLVEAIKGDILRERDINPSEIQLRVESVLDGGHLLMAFLPKAPPSVQHDATSSIVSPTRPQKWVTILADRYVARGAKRAKILKQYAWLSGNWIVDIHVTHPG